MRAVESLSPGKDAVVEQTAKAIAYFVSTLFLATGLVQVRKTYLSVYRTFGQSVVNKWT